MKILVSDLDGTIVNDRKVEEFDREKINKFISNTNNKLIIATGRSLVSFKRAISSYNLNFFDFAILCN